MLKKTLGTLLVTAIVSGLALSAVAAEKTKASPGAVVSPAASASPVATKTTKKPTHKATHKTTKKPTKKTAMASPSPAVK